MHPPPAPAVRSWSPARATPSSRRLAPDRQSAPTAKLMPTLVTGTNTACAHRAAPGHRGTRAARPRCRWLRQDHQRPAREAILAGDRDAEAMGKENAMAVICGITRDKRQHRKDSS